MVAMGICRCCDIGVDLRNPVLNLPWIPHNDRQRILMNLKEWVRGLAALVLLFDIYTVYQHLQLQRMRYRLAERDQIFQLISENAADMIAVVDKDGSRLYNSPAYQKILGYTPGRVSATSPMDQIHPDDRARVLSAADKARITGTGERLEYRIRHKNGSWRVLESTSNAIRGANSEIEGLVVVNRDITERKRAEEMLTHNAFHDGLDEPCRIARFFSIVWVALWPFPTSRRVQVRSAVHRYRRIQSLQRQPGTRRRGCPAHPDRRAFDCMSSPGRHDYRGEWQERRKPIVSDNTLARPGGDEFAVLAEELRNPSDAIRVAERIQKKLAVPFDVDGHEIVITASIGIAFSNNPSAEAEDVLRDAEIAMYRAKHSGKARCEVFDNAMHVTVRLSVCNLRPTCARLWNWASFASTTNRLCPCKNRSSGSKR